MDMTDKGNPWRRWGSEPPESDLSPETLLEVTRTPTGPSRRKHQAMRFDTISLMANVGGLYWRFAAGPRKMPPACDALGAPLQAGEVYVTGPGGALVPVTVEGVRWLLDRMGG
jgi:hypothetical protein